MRRALRGTYVRLLPATSAVPWCALPPSMTATYITYGSPDKAVSLPVFWLCHVLTKNSSIKYQYSKIQRNKSASIIKSYTGLT